MLETMLMFLIFIMSRFFSIIVNNHISSLIVNSMKVFFTRELPEIAFKLLKQNKIPFDYYKKVQPIPRQLLLQKVKNCDALISLLTEKIDKEVIDLMPNCQIIANYAAGYNNIDIAYAKKRKIIVTNTPDVLTESTADLTMALVLACARRLSEPRTPRTPDFAPETPSACPPSAP